MQVNILTGYTAMNMPHIAQIDYVSFYRAALPSEGDTRTFVNCVEAIPTTTSKAKVVMHQAARLLWLADRVEEVARGRPALQVLFYLIAAEAVAKIVFGFQGEGESRRHVRLFFDDICSLAQRAVLERAFSRPPAGSATLSLSEAVDYLYDVRCDVVHEGMYFLFALCDRPGGTPMQTPYNGAFVYSLISLGELRQVLLEGAVLGIRRLIPAGGP